MPRAFFDAMAGNQQGSVPTSELDIEAAHFSNDAVSDGRVLPGTLQFTDVSFTVVGPRVAGKPTRKLVLANVSGRVQSGQVLTILGPPGAGASALVDVLSLRASAGEATGCIALDGEAITGHVLRRQAAVVALKDVHWPALTCQATLSYVAELCLRMGKPERDARVRQLLTDTGLEGAANLRVGRSSANGLSLDLKRRLSIALALLKQPTIIFVSDLTAGLDSASASKMVRLVRDLAIRENVIFVTSARYVSSAVYRDLDQVIVLAKGRPAFAGSALAALSWLESLGFPLPAMTNPGDHLVDAVNPELVAPEQPDYVLQRWKAHNRDGEVPAEVPAFEFQDEKQSDASSTTATFCTQLGVVLRRHSAMAVLDPLLFRRRAVAMLITCAILAIVHIESSERDQDQIISKMFLAMWFVGVPASLAVFSVFAYNRELKAARREIGNGFLSPPAFLLGTTLVQIPAIFFFSLMTLALPAYAIAEFDASNFGITLVVHAAALAPWEALAQLLGAHYDGFLPGMAHFLQVAFMAAVFAGFLVPVDQIVWPPRALTYVSPFRYAMRGVVYAEFIDVSFGACGANPSEPCYGDRAVPGRQDGGDVLNSLGDVFGPFSDDNTMLQDALVPLAIAIFFKILHAIVLNRKSTKAPATRKADGAA